MRQYLLAALVLVLAVGGGFYVYFREQNSGSVPVGQETQNPGLADYESAREPSSPASASGISWQQTGQGWQPTGTPPDCPSPVFTAPVDLGLATSILYPGQTRGGNYKPHGGFRFDGITDNRVTLSIPLDAVIVDGARYLVGGETQYTFDFVAPCGYMYRFGHLLILPDKFQQLADQFPTAVEGDSRTTNLSSPVAVTKGEVLATAVGVTKDTNTFVDFGVYDLRQKNAISHDPTWAAAHDPSLAPYAVCWFDLLPSEAATLIRSLPPGDPTSGKTSDYCH